MRKNKVLTALCIIIAVIQLTAVITFANSSSSESSASNVPFVPTYKEGSFGEFLQDYAREAVPDVTVMLDLANPSASENISYGTVDGKSNVLITEEEGYVEFTVEVPATGLYSIGVDYYPIKGKSSAIERNIYINGELPYTEARAATLDRIYKDNVEDLHDYDSFFTKDAYGNETRKQQVENPYWVYGASFRDASASYDMSLRFYLQKGTNVIRIESLREPCAFSAIYLYGEQKKVSFGEYKLEKLVYQIGGDQLITKVQTEYPYAKNDPTLFASYDRSSAGTEPQSVDTIRLNTMGGNSSGDPRWRVSGQWIEYQVDVPQAGLYKIVFRSRQNTLNGSFVSREISINGDVQFAEASTIKFTFSDDWQMVTPTDEYGEPLLFFFEEGTNTIRLKAVYGDMADIINAVEAVIENLNEDYRKILMLTGTSPDKYRDYEFEETIPEVVADFKAQGEILKKVNAELINILGQAGQYTATIQNIYNLLYNLNADPESIAAEFTPFKNAITNLGSWLLAIRSLPLEIDYFIVAEENYTPPAADVNVFETIWFNVKMFFSSFVTDFNSISSAAGESYNETATVWTMSARDQAQVLRQLIDRSFIPDYQIDLQFSLVPGGALLPSILAGKGPDVVLGVGTESVVNYATRNALEPLNDYEGFDEIVNSRFVKNATRGMSVDMYDENGEVVIKTFGIPETMGFQVLFYRSDIMEELGINVPNTWDDVYDILPILNKRYMDYAPPEYNTLLYQAGGQLYKYNGQASDIDSVVGIETFIQHTEFYTNYGLPISFDFENRFRLGEMPIGDIDLYGFYNKMSVFAPEIKGLWTFTTLPGTVKEDGSIDKSNMASFSATVLLQTADNKQNGWKFIDWWTSDEIQTDYGRELESVLGAAGRYNSANISAVLNMNWTANEQAAIEAQFESLVPYPEVIGGYYTGRYVGFAFTNSVVDYDDPRESLLDNIRFINEEIIRKRQELDLPLNHIDLD